jgi:hypothetical protein
MNSEKDIKDIKVFDTYRDALADYFDRLSIWVENTTILPNNLKLIWSTDRTLTNIVQIESFSMNVEK